MKKLIHLVTAARPNLMKARCLYHSLDNIDNFDVKLVHTGQHYDESLFHDFLKTFKLPKPHISLEIGSGSHASQLGRTMMAYDEILNQSKPDLVIVIGDVNATLACAIVAQRRGVLLAHLEAGLRSFDRQMPEELNRILTDQLADICWTSSKDADLNLQNEGIPLSRVKRVGNTMIDTLFSELDKAQQLRCYQRFGLEEKAYFFVTLHRPSNVDDIVSLNKICMCLKRLSRKNKIVFSLHPRTKKNLTDMKLISDLESVPQLILLDPCSYHDCISFMLNAKAIITDSGGLQEESSVLGVPCLTLRNNTERPITLTEGSNRLVNIENIEVAVKEIAKLKQESSKIEYWDGQTHVRISAHVKQLLLKND